MNKSTLREIFRQARDKESEKHAKSLTILDSLRNHGDFQNAHSVLYYLGVRSEVETLPLVEAELRENRRRSLAPYCDGDNLKITLVLDMVELTSGAFGLLELDSRLRNEPGREILPSEVDLVVVPGVAFDRSGHRLGYGKGYYDQLLPRLQPNAKRVGLAFHSQVAEALPSEPHDQRVDWIITEREIIETGARGH